VTGILSGEILFSGGDIARTIQTVHCRFNGKWVAQATGLCRPATRRAEWEKANFLRWRHFALWASNDSGRRVADRNGRVARSTYF
jgi:hypothetical protein